MFVRALSGFVVAVVACLGPAAATDLERLLADAAALRQQGRLTLAVGMLERAVAAASPGVPSRLWGELGATYLQARQLSAAERALERARSTAGNDTERAVYANDLGNVEAARRRNESALWWYEEARSLGVALPALRSSAALNLARVAPDPERAGRLQQAFAEVEVLADRQTRARQFLNLGTQARALGRPAAELAYRSLERARADAAELRDAVLEGEALDALAQLYEDHRRLQEALVLGERGVAVLRSEPASEVLIQLHWRRGRILKGLDRPEEALAAYQAAVEHIEAIRQDIPVEYVDGRSSFRETLEPIYLGLADLLLQQGRSLGANRAALHNLRARDTLELIKQSELQDYLGDRCATDDARFLPSSSVPAFTAIVYPVILPDRLELLVETRAGLTSHTVAVTGADIRELALVFARSVRFARLDAQLHARRLYDHLLRPLEPVLAENRVESLVIVPDGPLRLVPFGALHDGERYAIERFAVATASGRTLTSGGAPKSRSPKVLLAGLSEPGPVVEKLPKSLADEFLADEVPSDVRSAELRGKLALPSVKAEIEALRSRVRNVTLLDRDFTVERFRQELTSGDYRIVHVASHAVFSRKADTSFIMAFDDVLTTDELQKLLRSEKVEVNPLEMLTLSACQTAEGDDRAPLGIAGAALKARAKTALGSLWPVSDDATKTLMVRFYGLLGEGNSKTEALRRAQVELLREPEFQHPFFWAPFILVGNWL